MMTFNKKYDIFV